MFIVAPRMGSTKTELPRYMLFSIMNNDPIFLYQTISVNNCDIKNYHIVGEKHDIEK